MPPNVYRREDPNFDYGEVGCGFDAKGKWKIMPFNCGAKCSDCGLVIIRKPDPSALYCSLCLTPLCVDYWHKVGSIKWNHMTASPSATTSRRRSWAKAGFHAWWLLEALIWQLVLCWSMHIVIFFVALALGMDGLTSCLNIVCRRATRGRMSQISLSILSSRARRSWKSTVRTKAHPAFVKRQTKLESSEF